MYQHSLFLLYTEKSLTTREKWRYDAEYRFLLQQSCWLQCSTVSPHKADQGLSSKIQLYCWRNFSKKKKPVLHLDGIFSNISHAMRLRPKYFICYKILVQIQCISPTMGLWYKYFIYYAVSTQVSFTIRLWFKYFIYCGVWLQKFHLPFDFEGYSLRFVRNVHDLHPVFKKIKALLILHGRVRFEFFKITKYLTMANNLKSCENSNIANIPGISRGNRIFPKLRTVLQKMSTIRLVFFLILPIFS